jgi:hypothetical protein
MITIEKINIYKKYDGDIDAWIRLDSQLERSIKEKEWYEIDDLIQSLTLIKNAQVSKEFEEEINRKLTNSVSESCVADTIRSLA